MSTTIENSKIVIVNDTNFELEVEQYQGFVLVEFGAVWCAPCKKQTPILEKFAAANEIVKVCVVDIDDAPAITSKLGIRSVPSLLFFENGVRTGMKVGLTSFKELGEAFMRKEEQSKAE